MRCGKKLAGPDCIIATAAYGSPAEPRVEELQAFRDAVLLRSAAGRVFVSFYNAVSPPLAEVIRHRPRARRVVRGLLSPLVWSVHSAWGRGRAAW